MASRARKEEKNEKLIRALSKLKENKACINCNSLVPQYICTNFWTFVCLTCSGIHREFTHRVKSISMSKFTAIEVAALNSGGNQRARDIYLKNWDFQRNSLPDSSNVERLRSFIKQVYVERRYAAEGLPPKNRVDDYGRFSVDSRYPDDMLDAGRFSLSSYRGGGGSGNGRGLCLSNSNSNGDSNGCLSSCHRGNDSNGDGAGNGHFSIESENGQGDGMRRHSNYDVYWGDRENVRSTSSSTFGYKRTVTFKSQSQQEDQRVNQQSQRQGRNIGEYAGTETFSQNSGKAESGLPNGDGKNIQKYASFSNGTPAEHNLAAFKRANSDSLIDFGTATDSSIRTKDSQLNLFGSQGVSPVNETWVSPVNEGWATFDVHPSPPLGEVETFGMDTNVLVQTSEKQNLESEAPAQPVLRHFGNGSLDAQPSYPHHFSKGTAQKQNPFSSTATVFEDSQQPCTWELHNTSMTRTGDMLSSDLDQKQHPKESSSSFVQHRKSKNPFDIPEDYVPSSTVSFNFPSMDTLLTTLPVFDSSQPALSLGSNSGSALQSQWTPTSLGAAAAYSSQTPLVSCPLQVTTMGHAMGSVNSCTQWVDSAHSTGGGLQLPVQYPNQNSRSNNPFD